MTDPARGTRQPDRSVGEHANAVDPAVRRDHIHPSYIRLQAAPYRTLMDRMDDDAAAALGEFERLARYLHDECMEIEERHIETAAWPDRGADPAETVRALGALRRADLLQFSALFKMQELKMLKLDGRIRELEEAATKP